MSRSGNHCWALFAALGVGLSGAVQAETLPTRGALDPRVRTALYRPGEVYRLTGYVGYHIHLQWEPGETFVGLGAGDVEGVSFTAQGSHGFLKPKAAPVSTNLTLITNRRHYHFEYHAEARAPGARGEAAIYSLTFTYDPPIAVPAATVEPAVVVKPVIKNADYGFCGSRSLKPLSVYDDGVRLYVRFPARVDWPAVFVRHADGDESLVNFTVERDELIVHRLAPKYILRRGKQVACLINRAHDASVANSANERVL